MIMSILFTVIDLIHKHLCNRHAELLIGSFEMVFHFIGEQVNGMHKKLHKHFMSVINIHLLNQ